MVQRHDTLRKAVKMARGDLIVIDSQNMDDIFTYHDLVLFPSQKRQQKSNALMLNNWHLRFDLSKDAMIRCCVIKEAEQSHLIHITLHHIAMDGWSFDLILQEMEIIYNSVIHQAEFILPVLPIQYQDFSLWQHKMREHLVFKNQLNYWKIQLKGAEEFMSMPLLKTVGTQMIFPAEVISFQIKPKTYENVNSLCKTFSMTSYSMLLSAFSFVISKFTGQDDIIIGSPVTGRQYQNVKNLVGFFSNMLPLRIRLQWHQPTSVLLKHVWDVICQGFSNQDIPFYDLVEALSLERTEARHPLVRVVFNMASSYEKKHMFGQGDCQRIFPKHNPGAKFDITLFAVDRGDIFECKWVYNRSLFTKDQIDRLIREFVTFLERMPFELQTTLKQTSTHLRK